MIPSTTIVLHIHLIPNVHFFGGRSMTVMGGSLPHAH
jgi:hypothetical protein